MAEIDRYRNKSRRRVKQRLYAKRFRTKHREKLLKERALQRQQDWYKEKGRAYFLKRSFNLTIEEYDSILEKQGGVCAICGRSSGDKTKRRLHVDHDHKTGRVRGLLCQKCNVAIGLLDDEPSVVRKALSYLEKHKVFVLPKRKR